MNSLEHGGRCCLTCIFAVCLLIYFTPLAMITIGNRLNQALIVNPDLKVALIVNLGVKISGPQKNELHLFLLLFHSGVLN